MRFEPTEQQREVIDALQGDLLVTAGAGSGKTRVLAERFASAVLGDVGRPGVAIDRLLGIAYTEKAAGELGERIRRVFLERHETQTAREVDRAWLSTIHGFCSRVLRRHPIEAGIDPMFAVADEVAAAVMRGEAFEAAARAAMEEDPGVERLVLDYGAQAARESVMSVLDDLRARGETTSVLAEPTEAALGTSLHDAADEAEALARTIAAAATCASDKANAQKLRDLGRSLRDEAGSPLGSQDADVLLRRLAQFKLTGGGRGEERREAKEAANGLRDRLVERLADVAARPYLLAFARLLASYEARYAETKAVRGMLDFEDLQLTTADLFVRHPDVAEAYRERFALVMVDEFQDTNALQTRIVEAVSEENLCVVGDDRQSIYGFRHADVEIFRQRARQVAEVGGASRSLSANFRSHPGVLDFTNAAFSRPPFFPDGFLELQAMRNGDWKTPLRADMPRVEVSIVEREGWGAAGWRYAEAAHLAARLRELRDAGVRPGDMVLLLRSLGCADTYEEALRAEGLPVYVAAGGAFFGRPEVVEVKELLGVIANPRDDERAATLLAGPIAGLSDGAVWRLAQQARSSGSLWDSLARAAEAGLEGDDLHAAERLHRVVSELRESQGTEALADVVLYACGVLGYEAALCEEGMDGERAWANIRKLARLADEFECASPGDAGSFLEFLALREEHQRYEPLADVSSESAEAVRILTTHAAKGLEFPVVAVADLGHGLGGGGARRALLLRRGTPPSLALRLPKPEGDDGDAIPTAAYLEVELEAARRAAAEEKRVLYVACTRAEELLILSGGSRLGKTAEDTLPIGWLREALGFGAESSATSCIAQLGAARVRVRVVTPEDGLPQPAGTAMAREQAEAPAGACVGPPPVLPRETATPAGVSYSSLHTFEECPLRFFAEHAARLGRVREDSPAKRLGSAVHVALQLDGGWPEIGAVASVARYHQLDAAARVRLELAIRTWRGSSLASRVSASPRVAREVPFALSLDASVLVGDIDVLAWEGDTALVVDYKTGTGAASGRADARRTQAECYALAALAAGACSVEVAFIELERGGEVTSSTFSAEDGVRARERLASLVARMRAGDRAPRKRWAAGTCRGCPAALAMCPLRPPGTPG